MLRVAHISFLASQVHTAKTNLKYSLEVSDSLKIINIAIMTSIFTILTRNLSTTIVRNGKRNPRKWLLYNKAGHRAFKEAQRIKPHPNHPIHPRGTKITGVKIDNYHIAIPEMIPELIVPNLEGCTLKPYVSYQVTNVTQSKFTSQNLFDAIYYPKIKKDWETGKLDENGNPLEPSANELLTAEEAKRRASSTGCDIFTQDVEPSK